MSVQPRASERIPFGPEQGGRAPSYVDAIPKWQQSPKQQRQRPPVASGAAGRTQDEPAEAAAFSVVVGAGPPDVAEAGGRPPPGQALQPERLAPGARRR